MQDRNKSLDGRVAIVTGAGRGIGREIALTFARAGAHVLVCTRGEAAGKETVQGVQALGRQADLLSGPIGSRAACAAAVEQAASRWGRLDIIVHNAAHIPYTPLAKISDEDLELACDTNIKALVWFIQAGMPWLVRSPAGRIILTSSTSADQNSVPGLSFYGATKAGIQGLVRGAALELGPSAITVNAVAPGATLSDAFLASVPPNARESMAATMPLGRIGSCEDIAEAMLFLASTAGGYVTGQTIIVDGGQSLGMAAPLDLSGLHTNHKAAP